MFFPVEIFVDALVRKSLMLSFIGLHLRDEIDEMLWLFKELQFFSIDQVAKLILDLNDQLNSVKTVETVVSEIAIEGDASLLSGSKVILDHGEDVLFDLIIRLQDKGIFLLGFHILPHRNLISSFVIHWH